MVWSGLELVAAVAAVAALFHRISKCFKGKTCQLTAVCGVSGSVWVSLGVSREHARMLLAELAEMIIRPKCRALPLVYSAARHMAAIKRFYRRTNVLSSGNGKFEVTLDQRKLKTPKGHVFEARNRPLALAVAAEWDAQKDTIDRSNMHLTALCNTALDNPHDATKKEMVSYMVSCLESDTILFQSSDADELYRLQKENWDPLMGWFCERYRVDIGKTQSIQAPSIPARTKETMTRHLSSYDVDAVYGLKYAVDAVKSVIITLATVERVIGIEEAVRLSRLEEIYQTSHWGSVEWSHGLSREDSQARLSAAVLFIHLNSYSVVTRPKGSAVR